MLLNLLGQNAHVIGRARYYFWVRHHILTIRLGLIAVCLTVTLLSALLLQKSLLTGLLPFLLMLGLAGFLFVYYNLELAILVTLVLSTFLHVGVETGTGTPITFTFVLLTLMPLTWFLKMLLEKSFRIYRLPANRPAFLFMVTVVIALLWSGAFVDDGVRFLFMDKVNPRLMTAVTIIVSVLTYFVVAHHIRSLRAMKFFVGWFIFAGTVIAILILTTQDVSQPFNDGGQLSAFVGILAMGQVLFNQNLPRILKFLLIGITVLWFYIVYILGVTWLSGWGPFVLGIAVLFSLRSRRLMILCLVAGVIYVANNTNFLERVLDTEKVESGETRWEAWGRSLNLTRDHLLFGTGPAGYHFYFTVYIGGLYQLNHNNYMDILSQTGIVGFTFYIWTWLAIGWLVWRTYRTVPRQGFRYGLAASLVAAYIITMFVMLLGDWVTPFPYTLTLAGIDSTIWHWMLAGLSVALYYESQPVPEPLPASENP